MNWRKFFGSKKIFILSILPSILVHIFDYRDYLDRKRSGADCRWGGNGEVCKNYFDYIGNSIGGWDFVIWGNSIFITASLLLLGIIYFLIHNKKKVALFLFILLVALVIWFFVSTGRF